MMIYQELRPKKKKQNSTPDLGIVKGKDSYNVQISREWMLPPKARPGRKPGKKMAAVVVDKNRNEGTISSKIERVGSMNYSSLGIEVVEREVRGEIMNSSSYADRRRKQNRDAQRAYRERKADKLDTLQQSIDTINSRCDELSDEVNLWKSRYENLVEESRKKSEDAEDRIKLYSKDNSELKDMVSKLKVRVQELESSTGFEKGKGPIEPVSSALHAHKYKVDIDTMANSNDNLTCSICSDGSCICDEIYSDESANVNVTSTCGDVSRLESVIDNFKPTKAVRLSKRKTEALSLKSLPQFKRLHSSQPDVQVDTSVITKEISEGGCGFCSDQSACVCRELEEQTGTTLDQECSGEPGSCAQCQNDAKSKLFCQNVMSLATSDDSDSTNRGEYIPINDAFQRIKKRMKPPISVSSASLKYDALALDGRKIKLKSVMDVIHDMNKNFM